MIAVAAVTADPTTTTKERVTVITAATAVRATVAAGLLTQDDCAGPLARRSATAAGQQDSRQCQPPLARWSAGTGRSCALRCQ